MIPLATEWRLYLGVAATVLPMPLKTDYVGSDRRDSVRGKIFHNQLRCRRSPSMRMVSPAIKRSCARGKEYDRTRQIRHIHRLANTVQGCNALDDVAAKLRVCEGALCSWSANKCWCDCIYRMLYFTHYMGKAFSEVPNARSSSCSTLTRVSGATKPACELRLIMRPLLCRIITRPAA